MATGVRITMDQLQDGGVQTGTGRPALALGALLTAVKVALAGIAILVVLPAAIAAQVAIAR